jgi:uncharacterized membrane protein YciS (DUF1049 family)
MDSQITGMLGLAALLLILALAVAWILMPILVIGLRSQMQAMVREQATANQRLEAIATDARAMRRAMETAESRASGAAGT